MGQFFTTNSDYILAGFEKYVCGKDIIDPFAGSGDLLTWAEKNMALNIKGYDIDKKLINKKIHYNDSLNNHGNYKFILTNPPYLNINKADIQTKNKYFSFVNFEDLYQAALFSIMNSEEGIVIVPINFLSAENSQKIREIFFTKFEIIEMNYFKQQVFSDTTYNVISFYYKKKKNIFSDNFIIKTKIYPDFVKINIKLEKKFDWTIGGKLLSQIRSYENKLGIYRLTEDHIQIGNKEISVAYNHIKDIRKYNISEEFYKNLRQNIILLRAIDSGTDKGRIKLENIKNYDLECLISKESSRNMIYLIFKETISVYEQEKIIELFNSELNKIRENYLSLFLTNFRDNDRKRISFDFAYKLINYLYFTRLKNSNISNNIMIKYQKQQQLSFI